MKAIREASNLIRLLLKRPTEYKFICGKTTLLEKPKVNKFNIFGPMESCMHACPDAIINGDVNSCPYFEKHRQYRP